MSILSSYVAQCASGTALVGAGESVSANVLRRPFRSGHGLYKRAFGFLMRRTASTRLEKFAGHDQHFGWCGAVCLSRECWSSSPEGFHLQAESARGLAPRAAHRFRT
jgi:hypothetical protein